jgi:hypothetical protein
MLVTEGDGITAAMPYYMPCKGIITMPPYTQTMGIWFNPEFAGAVYSKELHRKQIICDELIGRLPAHDYFLQNFHYSFTDWLPFYWRGFRQTTRYTCILPDISDTDRLWSDYLYKIRRQGILRARKKYHLEVRKDIPANHFMKLNEETYRRQGLKPYCDDVLKRLITTSVERGQGSLYGAYDDRDRLNGAVFIAHQKSCAYCIAGGSDYGLRHSGGHVLALWHAICDVSQSSASFNFCGSMMHGIADFFREFGALQTPYFVIERGKMDLLKRLRIKLSR